MSKILMGSTYFFQTYSDFKSKDIDEIELIETNQFTIRQLTGQGKCYFQLKKLNNTEEYINHALQSNLGMVVGKFLIPEFNALINFTIEDLPKLKPLIDILDNKHQYEAIIYNAYLENNCFKLTEEQRQRAYESYKNARI